MKSVRILVPLTEKAKVWVHNNVSYEPWQRFGDDGVAIEWRFLDDILEELYNDGFKAGEDYFVHG
ncbi:hypothetical protein KAW65_00165 [candidate division WOR-3 bacterium]|nr:hypothetical protein [candidate division WOR-3 bacterium]